MNIQIPIEVKTCSSYDDSPNEQMNSPEYAFNNHEICRLCAN